MPSQQPDVRGAHAREPVDSQADDRMDEDPEDVLGRDGLPHQRRVQAVDALQQQDLVRLEVQRRSRIPEALAVHEVEAGGPNLLTREQARQVIVQQRQIDGFEGLEVVPAFRIARRAFPVDVVVVERDRARQDAVDLELHREPLDEGRLAGRRRSGDADDLQLVGPGGDLVGDAPDPLLVKALGGPDQLRDVAGDAASVERADAVGAQRAEPRLVRHDHLGRSGHAVARGPVDRRVSHLPLARRQVGCDRPTELEQQHIALHAYDQVVEHARSRQERPCR
jgi:hypothetical protein